MKRDNRFGYNVLQVNGLLRPHLQKINPGGMVYFQNDLNEALWAKQQFPNAHIVIRYYPDANNHTRYSPENYVEAHKHLIGTGLILQTSNESGFNKPLIDWTTRVLQIVRSRNIDLKLGVLGLSVGTPKPDELIWGNDMFKLMAQMPGVAYLILHEYFGGVITSGIIGGHPDNAGVAPGKPGGTNLIPMSNWPRTPTNETLWHVGRYWFLKRHLAAYGIPMPKIIIGEFGADYTSDIDAFLRNLNSNAGQYDVADGWHDLHNEWAKWYPGMSPSDVYMYMGGYADQRIYGHDVEAIIWYGWGDTPEWDRYRTDPELNNAMETYATNPATYRLFPDMPPAPPAPPTQVPLPLPLPPAPTAPIPVIKDRSGELLDYMRKALDNWK